MDLLALDGTAIAKALAWPLAVLLAAIIIALSSRGPRWIAFLQARLAKVEAFGVKVELTENAATETRQSIEDAFDTLRTRVRREFDYRVQSLSIGGRLEGLIDGCDALRQRNRGQSLDGLRSTIYVPDPLVSTYLYQLLDYYPSALGDRGRIVSRRFGIVGRAWRSGQAEVAGRVPPDVTSRLREWGMTKGEAADRGGTRQSYLAIPILAAGTPVGILYLDASKRNAFGDEDRLSAKRDIIVTALTERLSQIRLGDDLLRINREVGLRTPGIALAN